MPGGDSYADKDSSADQVSEHTAEIAVTPPAGRGLSGAAHLRSIVVVFAALLVTLVSLQALAPAARAAGVRSDATPITGSALPGMSAWDTAAEQIMASQGIPGAALVVAYDGRVVLEQGLGYADTATHQLVQPSDRFRLASMTKSLTATAINQLIERHQLTLETHPFETVLSGLRTPDGQRPVDSRVDQITIKELLAFTAGWNNTAIGFDPTLTPSEVEPALHIHTAPSCQQVIEFMLGRRLNNAPGTHYSYSNLSYCVLGEVIAHEMHTSYVDAMRELVFAPLGMPHTTVSLADPTQLLPDEVHYYGHTADDSGADSPSRLPLVGAFGAAGVVSTAPDLIRFVVTTAGVVAGSRPWYDPAPSISFQPYPFSAGQEIQFEIDGSLPGTSTSWGQYATGGNEVDYVFLGNSRTPTVPISYQPFFSLAQSQTSWPTGDLASPPLP